jgi:hypothetical protein
VELKDLDIATLLATLPGVVAFFTLLFPGILATFLWDLRVPGERRNFGDLGIAIVGLSVLIDLPALIWLQFHPLKAGDQIGNALFIAIAGVVLPGLAGWFAPDLRHLLASNGLALASEKKAWDKVFSTLVREKKPIEMKITLASDEIVYAIWGEGPFASSYPADEDLFLTVPCLLAESGKWQRVENSGGVMLSRKDIRVIEMFRFGTFADLVPETDPVPAAVTE